LGFRPISLEPILPTHQQARVRAVQDHVNEAADVHRDLAWPFFGGIPS
jgi:hypothetical protein